MNFFSLNENVKNKIEHLFSKIIAFQEIGAFMKYKCARSLRKLKYLPYRKISLRFA